MQQYGQAYDEILNGDDGAYWYEVKLTIDGVDYGMDSIFSAHSDCKLFESAPTIGGCYSGTLEFSVLGDGASIPKMAKVIPYLRVVAEDGRYTNWKKKGEFFIDTRSVTHNDNGLTVFEAVCFDAMLKANAPYANSSLAWPATDTAVVAEIASAMGVTQDSRNAAILTGGYSISVPTQYTMRDVLSFIGAMYAANWIISDDGKLRIVPIAGTTDTLTVNKSCSNLNVSPLRSAYTKLVYELDENHFVESGSTETNVMEVYNPMGTQAEADAAFAILSAWQYQPFEASGVFSDPAVELGDKISVVGVSGVIYSRKITFGTAMAMNLSAPNDNYIDHEYEYESPEERRYQRTVAGMSSEITIATDGVTILSQKLENLGGRNLIINTFAPSVDAITEYPRLYAQTDNTLTNMYMASTATHGIRLTKGTSDKVLLLSFGQSDPQSQDCTMNGLQAGESYTMSFGLQAKALSNSNTAARWRLAFASWDSQDNITVQEIWLQEITNGTEETFSVSESFTIPNDAAKCVIQLGIRYTATSTSPPAADYAASDYYELTNIMLERGLVATDWTPAPEDEVPSDEIISRINVSPESIEIDSSKISLAGKTIDLTSDTIQITSTNFSVDSAGIITATGVDLTGSFNMTGGSINITTDNTSYDAITLVYNDNYSGTVSTTRSDIYGFHLVNTSSARTYLSNLYATNARWERQDSTGTKTIIIDVDEGISYNTGSSYNTAKIGGNGQFLIKNTSDDVVVRAEEQGITFYDQSGNVLSCYVDAGMKPKDSDDLLNGASLASGAQTNVRSITLSTGRYLLEGYVCFAANATGVRVISLSNTSASYNPSYGWNDRKSALPSGWYTTTNVVMPVTVTSSSQTFYLVAYQNSGAALGLQDYQMFAIRLP